MDKVRTLEFGTSELVSNGNDDDDDDERLAVAVDGERIILQGKVICWSDICKL